MGRGTGDDEGAVMRTIIVGEAPGPRTDPSEPLNGYTGHRMASLMQLDHGEFLQRFERINLLDEPKEEGKFDLARAKAKADDVREGWQGRQVVLLGRLVALSFGLRPDTYEWFEPMELSPSFLAAVCPHPSGVSRWWNEPENTARAREFMLALKLGFLDTPKRRGKDRFSIAQVAAALEAGRGIFTKAARALSEATGVSCGSQTIRNYVDKYPEQLGPIFERAQVNMAGMVVEGVFTQAEAGDLAALKELARWRCVQDMARERLLLNIQHSVGVEHSGTVRHDVVVQVEDAWQRLVGALEVDDRPPALTKQ